MESDILLLDISNKDEYIWTNSFEPSPPPPPPPPPPPSSSSSSSSAFPSISPTSPSSSTQATISNNTIIGIVIGTLVGGVLLGVGGAFLHRWNKNKRKWKKSVSTPESEEGNRHYHENLQSKTRKNSIKFITN
jgi:hypothetical protein